MLKIMSKYFLFFIIFFIKINFVNAEIVKSIFVNGNDRIADRTVIIFSKVNIGDELIINDLNEILLDIKSDIVYRKNKALVINLFKRMVL